MNHGSVFFLISASDSQNKTLLVCYLKLQECAL